MEILTLTETKDQGITDIGRGHTLLYSGVQNNTGAQAGVDALIQKNFMNKKGKCNLISERMMTITAKTNRKETQVKMRENGGKELFWHNLQK